MDNCNQQCFVVVGKNLPDKVTADLKTLIHQISKVCLQAIKPETPYVLDVISKDYSQATPTDWELDRSHWLNVIAHLQLTEQQVGVVHDRQVNRYAVHGVKFNNIVLLQIITILRSREAHVQKMMGLFQERALLMRQAAELALSAATVESGRSLMPDGQSTLAILMRHGYLYCARNMVSMHKIAETVKVSEQGSCMPSDTCSHSLAVVQ